jgi:transglycosylase-like protein with SLT domain
MRFCSETIVRMAFLASLISCGLTAESAVPTAPAGPAEAPRAVSVVRTDARTGRLVRRIIISPDPPQPGSTKAIDPGMLAAIDETAKNLQVSPELVHSVIQVESNYNTYAVSPKGAEGLMQLMPATARRFGVTNSFDPRQNIEGGVRYLKFLQETFQDDRLAIAAYNAGEKAVSRYGGVPPYPETVNYVAKVGQKYSQAKKSAEKSKIEAKAPEQTAPKPADDEPRHVNAYLDTEGRLHIATR